MVNIKQNVGKSGLRGIYINGKYWCTKDGVICVVPDQWEDIESEAFPCEPLPDEVTEAVNTHGIPVKF